MHTNIPMQISARAFFGDGSLIPSGSQSLGLSLSLSLYMLHFWGTGVGT